MKLKLKGRRFGNIEIQAEWQTEKYFQEGFQK
jgi:hypothetical protein